MKYIKHIHENIEYGYDNFVQKIKTVIASSTIIQQNIDKLVSVNFYNHDFDEIMLIDITDHEILTEHIKQIDQYAQFVYNFYKQDMDKFNENVHIRFDVIISSPDVDASNLSQNINDIKNHLDKFKSLINDLDNYIIHDIEFKFNQNESETIVQILYPISAIFKLTHDALKRINR